MSNHAIVIALTVVLLMPFGSASAQTAPNPRLRELNAQFDSIWPLLVTAETENSERAKAALAAEAARKAEKLDTVMVGPLTVVARPQMLEEAGAYVTSVWQDFDRLTHGAEAKLAGITLLIEGGEAVPMFRPMSHRPRHTMVQLPTMLPPSARRAYLRRALGGHLALATPPAIREWLKGAPISLEQEMAHTFRELAVSRAEASSRCFRQDMEGCRAALALTPQDSLWSSWYTPAQLRQLAIESARPAVPVRDSKLDACVRRNEVADCAVYLRFRQALPLPLSEHARSSFLHFALEQGGEGSFARLIESTRDVETAIEQAAGKPIPTLLADWRAEVERARPEMHAGVTRSRLATVFWLLVCVGLSMRSSRWRLA
jgi:hypothetical protein